MVARDNPAVPAQPPALVKVRTTMRPWEVIEVPPGEVAVLAGQGLIYDGPPVTEADFDPRNTPPAGPETKPGPDTKPGKTKEAGQ